MHDEPALHFIAVAHCALKQGGLSGGALVQGALDVRRPGVDDQDA